MNGLGIIRGLMITFTHFIDTYVQDFRALRAGKKRFFTKEGLAERTGSQARGVVTVQYPDEKMPVPEEFRYIPFLVYEVGEDGSKNPRCTSCGICAKVCPPQCIWIVRTTDPNTGKPKPAPAQFYIDVDVCMNCGMCAEFCPFDAIKMDHDYEIASFDRLKENIFDIQRLLKPVSYYAEIRPRNYAAEEAARKAEKEAKAARKPGAAASN